MTTMMKIMARYIIIALKPRKIVLIQEFIDSLMKSPYDIIAVFLTSKIIF